MLIDISDHEDHLAYEPVVERGEIGVSTKLGDWEIWENANGELVVKLRKADDGNTVVFAKTIGNMATILQYPQGRA